MYVYIFFYVYEYVACMCVNTPMSCNAGSGQKVLDPLELELLTTMWVPGMKSGSSAITVSCINC